MRHDTAKHLVANTPDRPHPSGPMLSLTRGTIAGLFAGIVLGALPSGAALARTEFVPITFRQVSGTRPFIPVKMNGKSFLLMVHANADFTIQTTHENAASIGADVEGARKGYGIVATGKVSKLGRGETVLPSLEVGATTFRDLPLSVFSIPQDTPTDGMLGVSWLKSHRVIVDYDQGRLGLPETPADNAREDAALVEKGYVPHCIFWDEQHKSYYANAELNGLQKRLSVSTVSNNLVDLRYAHQAGIQLGPVVDQGSGPTGTLVPIYHVRSPVMLRIDRQVVPFVRPEAFDVSAYQAKPDPTYVDAATLGADFMLDNRAVIDFGTETLFLAPNP